MRKLLRFLIAASVCIFPISVQAQDVPPKGYPRANMAKAKQLQNENKQISAAATIEWYAKNCKGNVDASAVQRAQRFLSAHHNQARVYEIRGYIQLGAQQMLDPCIDGQSSLNASLRGFGRTF